MVVFNVLCGVIYSFAISEISCPQCGQTSFVAVMLLLDGIASFLKSRGDSDTSVSTVVSRAAAIFWRELTVALPLR